MDQPAFQQAWGCSVPLFDQQNHLVALRGDDPEDSSLTLTDWCDYEWNDIGCSQIAINVPNQTVPLFNSQPRSNPEPHSGLVRYWYTGCAASSSFGRSPNADLPLSAVDTECQFPAYAQSFQQNLWPWPQLELTAELNSIPIPYGNTKYESPSGFDQALTAGDALATERLGEPRSNPRKESLRCVKCWALRKPVSLFI